MPVIDVEITERDFETAFAALKEASKGPNRDKKIKKLKERLADGHASPGGSPLSNGIIGMILHASSNPGGNVEKLLRKCGLLSLEETVMEMNRTVPGTMQIH